MTAELIERLGYVGIPLLLILGGLGLPIPEEGPVILAAVLSRPDHGVLSPPLAFLACLIGVLAGDFMVYAIGYYQGERVLRMPMMRKFLSREREVQIKGYYHRHGFKILILGRFTVGFRTAAYLTAGIIRLGPLKLFLTDCVAALLSTSLMFGLGWVFAHQIEALLRAAQSTMAVVLGVLIAAVLLYRYVQSRKKAGKAVGPPVLVDTPALPEHHRQRLSHSQTAELHAQAATPPPETAPPAELELELESESEPEPEPEPELEPEPLMTPVAASVPEDETGNGS